MWIEKSKKELKRKRIYNYIRIYNNYFLINLQK